MSRDLGTGRGRVHQAAEAVLRFWLDETPRERRFARDDALDREITERFGALRAEAVAADATGWRDDPATLLAAVILIDQFGRNMFRGLAEAFAADGLARALAEHAIARGWDKDMSVGERQFLYMPFMHGEDPAAQDRAVALFATLGLPEAYDFAVRHRDQITRFGRFPGRNAALGRETTAKERKALDEGAAF